MDAVFVGNFVNDVIVKSDGKVETTTRATGGSVTYGTLASATYGSMPRIISNVGDDLPHGFLASMEGKVISEGICKRTGSNTSYRLHYNETNVRTLQLKEKGFSIEAEDVLKHVGRPDAIFFVPVAAEFDEMVVLEVARSLRDQDAAYSPIVALDVQGFIRTFDGKRVITRDSEVMMEKLRKLGSLTRMGFPTILKAEHAEAVAVLGPASPPECARRLRQEFGFTVASVTMGPLGGYVSSEMTGEIYVPTFKPRAVVDETGCGDTFLACMVLEILYTRQKNGTAGSPAPPGIGIHGEELIHAVLVGSAAASYLVECIGPAGFASRDQILQRISHGERTTEPSSSTFSVTVYKPKK